jgi:hypothetical protein
MLNFPSTHIEGNWQWTSGLPSYWSIAPRLV